MQGRLDTLAADCRAALAQAAPGSAADEGGAAGTSASHWKEVRSALHELLTEIDRASVAPTEGASVEVAAPRIETADGLLAALVGTRRNFVVRALTAGEQVFFNFRDGRLVDAVSTNNPPGDRLGELLVAGGAVSAEALHAALAKPAATGRIGQALLETGYITDADLRQALDLQRVRLFARLAREPNLQLSINSV